MNLEIHDTISNANSSRLLKVLRRENPLVGRLHERIKIEWEKRLQTLFAAITIALIFEWVPWSIVHLGNAETYARRGYFHSVAGKELSSFSSLQTEQSFTLQNAVNSFKILLGIGITLRSMDTERNVQLLLPFDF